jgi:hypothetical protein
MGDETKVEEWGRSSRAHPHFTVPCLQMRRPMQPPAPGIVKPAPHRRWPAPVSISTR